jgi:hypothetical protein
VQIFKGNAGFLVYFFGYEFVAEKIREEEQEDRAAKAAEKEREIAMKLQEQK